MTLKQKIRRIVWWLMLIPKIIFFPLFFFVIVGIWVDSNDKTFCEAFKWFWKEC